jgi:hypothetical protein
MLLLTITWTNADGRQPINLAAALANTINSTLDTVRQLTEPETLRGVLGYARPVMPFLANAAGVGVAGQWILESVLALVQHALDEAAHDGDAGSSRQG